jgi:hypothetical protein
MWFSSDGRRWSRLNSQSTPLFGFTFLQSISQRHLADRPQPVSPSHGLLLPSAHEEPKVHWSRALPARFVPPSGFGYPLDGFLPSIPRRFSFTPAALLGFTLRSFLPPRGRRTFPYRRDPRTVPPAGGTTCQAEGRPRRPRFLGFTSRKSLATERGFSTSTAGGSPGFDPSRVRSRQPGPGFRPTSSLALCLPAFFRVAAGAPEYRSATACLRSSPRVQSQEGVRRDPSRVPAPVQSRTLESAHASGYFFTSHRVAHYCRPPGDL